MPRWGSLLWLALLVAALMPGVAVAQSSGAPDLVVVASNAEDPLAELVESGDRVLLSDEERTTRWAHAQREAKIRTAPHPGARSIARLRFLTEDNAAEVYIVLEGVVDFSGRRWLHVRVPMRPNGRTGWVLDDALSQLYVARTQLVIDRAKLRATLFRRGKRIWSARVGIGRSRTPTPRGSFWIRERLQGLGDGTTYGSWAFGTSAYSNLSDWPGGGVIGIHGTNQPELIPGRPSHGCVRVRNDKMRQLARLMPVGTPVLIVG